MGNKKCEVVQLSAEELEAIRLYNVEDMDQTSAAKKMQTSQPTFARILKAAYKKVADALVTGKAIRIESPDQTHDPT